MELTPISKVFKLLFFILFRSKTFESISKINILFSSFFNSSLTEALSFSSNNSIYFSFFNVIIKLKNSTGLLLKRKTLIFCIVYNLSFTFDNSPISSKVIFSFLFLFFSSFFTRIISIFFVFMGIVSLKTLPFPTVLLMVKSPSKREANSFEIANPKPVPPYFLVLLPSTCLNLSKICLLLFAGIPIPVSIISKKIFKSF